MSGNIIFLDPPPPLSGAAGSPIGKWEATISRRKSREKKDAATIFAIALSFFLHTLLARNVTSSFSVFGDGAEHFSIKNDENKYDK
ncbi:hypothetical protein M569_14615 [Genlisea aurea]|uniref:Uncharacterized protein n=1 Tax=Genlisea aurea TaxID=192259 RepID=S8C0L1_9LAMI|nr:hypothetical protein M569_14615 [Genlisea aurea]